MPGSVKEILRLTAKAMSSDVLPVFFPLGFMALKMPKTSSDKALCLFHPLCLNLQYSITNHLGAALMHDIFKVLAFFQKLLINWVTQLITQKETLFLRMNGIC